jgi:hypothetical protein
VGDDGREIACFWLEVMRDPENPLRQRLEASKLLAEHGWGKPPSVDAAWSATVGKGEEVIRAESPFDWEAFDAELDRLATG